MSNFHRISTCVVCLRVFSNSTTAAESQDTFSSKICFKMLFPRARESPLIKMCLLLSYISRLLLGTTGSPSLCRRAEVDPHRRVDAVRDRPSGAPHGLGTTPRGGARGRRKRQGNKYCCIQKGRHHRDTEGRQARAHCKGTR